MSFIRPLRSAQAKGAGIPRVDWSRLPRGLTSNPLFQCNQCPDVVGNVPAYSWWQGDRGLVPTRWGLGLNSYYSEVSYPVPRSQFSPRWSRAVLIKTPPSIGAWGLSIDSGYGFERNLDINGSFKAQGYFWPSTPVTLTGTTTLAGDTLYMICMTYGGGVATLYVNGVQEAQSSGYSDNPPYAATTRYGSNGASGGDGGAILAGYGANVCWTPEEVLDLWRAPHAHLVFQDDPAFYLPDLGLTKLLLPTSSGVSGTLTATLGAATLSSTGTVVLAGTTTATLGAATLASTAKVAIAGTSTATLAAATLSATGTLAISGTATATLAATTVVAAGTLAIAGTTSATLAAATLSGTGTVSISATLSSTLDAATLSASGTASSVNTGTLTATLAAATLSAASTLALRGTTNTTLANATLSSTGTLSLRASSSVTLAGVSLNATGVNGNIVRSVILVWDGVRI